MEPRKQRGMIIAATKNVRRDGIRWIVPSQFSGAQYSVFLAHGDAVCTCPDYETRREMANTSTQRSSLCDGKNIQTSSGNYRGQEGELSAAMVGI